MSHDVGGIPLPAVREAPDTVEGASAQRELVLNPEDKGIDLLPLRAALSRQVVDLGILVRCGPIMRQRDASVKTERQHPGHLAISIVFVLILTVTLLEPNGISVILRLFLLTFRTQVAPDEYERKYGRTRTRMEGKTRNRR